VPVSNLSAIVTGPDGALWINHEPGNSIQRISTAGVVTAHPLPAGTGALSAPLKITAGPDGALWFTASQGGNLNFGGIGRITTAGSFTMYPLPASAGLAGAEDITAGPDGALWFTIGDGGQMAIGRVATGGAFTFYPITTLRGGITQLRGITAGPDGALWFCETNADVVGPDHYRWGDHPIPTPQRLLSHQDHGRAGRRIMGCRRHQ
jgi:virginiamycin B lyase